MVTTGDVKNILEGLKAAASVETREKLAQVSAAYFEVVKENFDLAEENAQLRKELARKKAIEAISGEYFVQEKDGSLTGPVCPACYDDGIIVILETSSKGGAQCSKCKARFAGVRASVEGPRVRIG